LGCCRPAPVLIYNHFSSLRASANARAGKQQNENEDASQRCVSCLEFLAKPKSSLSS
jgi:hypothetical protein